MLIRRPRVESLWVTARKDVALNNVGRSARTESSIAIFKFIKKKVSYHQSNWIYFHPTCFCMSDVKVSECCLCSNLRAHSCQPGAHFSNYSNSTWTWRVPLATEEPDVAFRGWWRTNRNKYSEYTIKKMLASKSAFEVYRVILSQCFLFYFVRFMLCYFLYLLVLRVSDWSPVYITLPSSLPSSFLMIAPPSTKKKVIIQVY